MQSSIYKYYFSMQDEYAGRAFNWGIQHKYKLEVLGMIFIPCSWTFHEIIELTLQNHTSMSYRLVKLIEFYFERYVYSNETVVLTCLIPTTGFYK